ncbi:MAG: DUF1570 domain-containing protein [Verrucomicrobiae bacterium]|nr:DUF1570 domain-containing protein [Verrucomicrobiae bacterium]
MSREARVTVPSKMHPGRFSILVVVALWVVGRHAQADEPVALDRFYNVSIGHYQVLSQAGRAIGNDANWFMNQMLMQYSKFFANWQPKQRARVIIFGNQQDFLAYAAAATSMTHTTLAGFCHLKTDADGSRYFELVTYHQPHLWRVLAHEGFHQFAYYELGRAIPIWLNEGLAQYFETSYVLRGRLVTGQVNAPQLTSAQGMLRTQQGPTIAELIQMDQRTFYERPAENYPMAWALVYFLLHRDPGPYASSDMKRYLQDLKLGKDSVSSFRQRFGRDLEALQEEFRRYVLGLKLSAR